MTFDPGKIAQITSKRLLKQAVISGLWLAW